MSETITAGELARILDLTTRGIQIRAAREKWPFREVPGRGRGGKRKEFVVSELPAEIQERIYRVRNGVEEGDVEEMVETFEINVPPSKISDPKVAMKIRMVSECLAVPTKARGRRSRIREIAEAYGMHVGSAYRLMEKVKKGKPIVTATKNHGIEFGNLGITLRAWDENAGQLAIEQIMQNKRGLEERLSLYSRVVSEAEKQGWKYGSYESFCSLARRISPAIITYRDKGMAGLRQDIVPPIRRDHTAYRVMENLVGDQHKADYFCFDYNGDVATLELFCWLDFRSQMLWGSISYKHYNRYTVGHALLNAVRWGLPSTVYTDWGKPELSNYVGQLIKQLHGLGVRLDGPGASRVRHSKAMPRHPQAKPIEGIFGLLDRRLRNDRIPGFCKRLKDARENELQQKEITRLIKTGGLLQMDELVSRVMSVIESWNNHRFKNRGVDNGRTPLEIYKSESKKHPVTTLSESVLEYLFLPIQETRIHRSQVKIKNDWMGSCVYHSPLLSEYGTRDATVRYDPFDPSQVWVFVGSELVAVCDEWRMINPKMADKVADRISHQKSLIRQIVNVYKKYRPQGASVHRINRHEKPARQLAEVKKQTEIRVMPTPLDDGGPGSADGLRRGKQKYSALYGMDRPVKKQAQAGGRSFMRLTIDDPYEIED